MKKFSAEFLKVLLPFIFFGISILGQAQNQNPNPNPNPKGSPDWEALKKTIRTLREKNEIPSWSRKPNYRGRNVMDSFMALNGLIVSTPPQVVLKPKEDSDSKKISPMLRTRYGDITLTEMAMLQAIVNSPNSESKGHIQHQLVAHGVEHSKGGIRNLINILIEGRIFGSCFGPLVCGNPALNAGNHGPFFIILDEKQARKTRGSFEESVHSGYLVPGERHRQKIVTYLKAAQEKGLLTEKETAILERKILTYEEFTNLAKTHPLSMMDGASFGAALVRMKEKQALTGSVDLMTSLSVPNPDFEASLCNQ